MQHPSRGDSTGRPWSRNVVDTGLALLGAGILMLMPKCPLCLVAYLGMATGLSLTFGQASALRVVLLIVAVSSVMLVAWRIAGFGLRRIGPGK